MTGKQRFQLHIELKPQEGREDEFHEWYENTHLDEVLATTALESAQRWSIDSEIGGSGNSHLAIYEGFAESAEQVMEDLNARRAERDMSDSMDASSVSIKVVSPLGEMHKKQ